MIQLNDRYTYFSHRYGEKLMLPGTELALEVYPTKIIISPLMRKEEKFEIHFDFLGPMKGFTIFQNLDKNYIEINGHIRMGHFRFRIVAKEEGIDLMAVKMPAGELKFSFISKVSSIKQICGFMHAKETLFVPWKFATKFEKSISKISFGVFKQKDVSMMQRRFLLTEYLPYWHLLSQKVPFFTSTIEGTAKFLDQCIPLICMKNKKKIEDLLELTLRSGFSTFLMPRLLDEEYQGILVDQKVSKKAHPTILFEYGKKIIESLFLYTEPEKVFVLTCMPPSISHGKAINLKTEYGTFDVEFSKKFLKKLVFRPSYDCSFVFKLQSKIKSFRMKESRKEFGTTLHSNDKISFVKGRKYFFDKFQK
ncbi:MAG TPA: hypothetical protein P5048_01450 [Chlamydiales bacterium]|nr:hypothetical protein [Chlamydiales bacterium]